MGHAVRRRASRIGWAVVLKYPERFTRPGPTDCHDGSADRQHGAAGVAVRTLPLGTAYAVWTGSERLGIALRWIRVGVWLATASGTSTVSRLSSQTSTGRTRKCVRTSGEPYASGPTGASTDSASTLPTACARTCQSRTRRGARSPTSCDRTARTRSGIATTSMRSMQTGGGSSIPTIRLATRLRRPSCTRHGARGTPSADSLGQAFNFAMQDADWRAEDYRQVIDTGLADMINSGATTSWLLGCHDTPRVATRYGLPLEKDRPAYQVARAWLLTDGTTPQLDRALGERRARAAIMILLALPGSTYIYQGDELGLQEVGDLPLDVLEDPDGDPLDDGQGPRRLSGTAAVDSGRALVRIQLGVGHLPQPDWFGGLRSERPGGRPDSTLTSTARHWRSASICSPAAASAGLSRSRRYCTLSGRRHTLCDQLRSRACFAPGWPGAAEQCRILIDGRLPGRHHRLAARAVAADSGSHRAARRSWRVADRPGVMSRLPLGGAGHA